MLAHNVGGVCCLLSRYTLLRTTHYRTFVVQHLWLTLSGDGNIFLETHTIDHSLARHKSLDGGFEPYLKYEFFYGARSDQKTIYAKFLSRRLHAILIVQRRRISSYLGTTRRLRCEP